MAVRVRAVGKRMHGDWCVDGAGCLHVRHSVRFHLAASAQQVHARRLRLPKRHVTDNTSNLSP